jgi:hypothetical protein
LRLANNRLQRTTLSAAALWKARKQAVFIPTEGAHLAVDVTERNVEEAVAVFSRSSRIATTFNLTIETRKAGREGPLMGGASSRFDQLPLRMRNGFMSCIPAL